MAGNIPDFLLTSAQPAARIHTHRLRLRRPLVDSALEKAGRFIRATITQWDSSSRKGLLQRVDARVKVVSLLFFLVVATSRTHLLPEVVLALVLFALGAAARLDLGRFYRRVGMLTFLFGFLPGFPAAFNLFTAGDIILPVATLQEPHAFWVYTVPQVVGITRQGITVVALLTLRVANCLALSFLLFSTTPLPRIAKSLKTFRIPDALLVAVVLAYKYILIFSTVLEQSCLAKKSRALRPDRRTNVQEWAVGRIALVLRRTQQECEEVYRAMASRGLAKDIRLPAAGRLGRSDVAAGVCAAAIGAFIIWI